MKITTLWTSPFKKDQYFTSEDAALAAFVGSTLVQLTGYPAVELPDGTFRLIDSDTIVAADREVKPVTLYEAVYAAAVFDDDYHTGAFFLDQQSALRKAQQAAKCAGHLWISARENEAIPLPDGTYRRVREGDVVRLWEPEPQLGRSRDWLEQAKAKLLAQCGADPLRNPYQENLDRAVANAKMSAEATQAAPESVEKPVGIFFYGEEVGSKLWVRKVFGRYERHAEITTETLSFSTYAEALECLRKTLYSAHGAQCGWLPEQKTVVTATSESQAGAEQDAFFHDSIHPNLHQFAAVCGIAEELQQIMDLREKKARQKQVSAIAVAAKSVLSLPAGAARAEAKLKLIGEISKL